MPDTTMLASSWEIKSRGPFPQSCDGPDRPNGRMPMFCYQCEQTFRSEGCTVRGICGKEDEVAALQDALIYTLKGLALVAAKAEPEGLVPGDTYPLLAEGLFATLTNVN